MQVIWNWKPSGDASWREFEPRPVNAVATYFHKTSCKNGLVMIFLEVAIFDFSAVLGGTYCQIRESLPHVYKKT